MITADQERARLLRERLEAEGLRRAAATVPPIPWRSHRVIVQAVFFGLTCAGLGAFYWLLHELDVPQSKIITGCVGLALAEYLIRGRRWFGTGVEAALWLGSLFAVISALPSSGRPERFLVLAAVPAIAGFRMRSPLFGALSTIFVILYFEDKLDLGVVSALLIASIAVLALLRTWLRPSAEWLWFAIAIVAPLAGRSQADTSWRNVTILLYCAFGATVLALAIWKRHHALLLSAGVALTIASIDIGRLFTMVLEAKLAIGGAFLLGGSWLISRPLRDRTSGIVVTPSSLTSFDDSLELAATAHLEQPEFESPKEVGGGRFGGAGATGSY